MKRVTAIAYLALLAFGLAACDQPAPATAENPDQGPGNAAQAGKPGDEPKSAVASKGAQAGTPAPDTVLSDKVKQALVAAPGLNAQDIDVAAASGVVTLYGTVGAKSDSERIALLAMSVDGVRSVVNNLVVVRGS